MLSIPITTLIVIAVVAVIATLLGGPVFGSIAVILFALIAIYGITWVLMLVVTQAMASLSPSLAQAQQDFTNALKDVIANCPEQCRGNTSTPQCSLE